MGIAYLYAGERLKILKINCNICTLKYDLYGNLSREWSLRYDSVLLQSIPSWIYTEMYIIVVASVNLVSISFFDLLQFEYFGTE